MALDVLRGLPARRVTSHAVISIMRILIDPNVIDTHERWQQLVNGLVDRCEVLSHAKVHNDGHWLCWDDSRTDVSVRADGSSVQGPGLVFADIPGHCAVRSGRVVDAVRLVRLAIVPVVVDVAQTGRAFLERTTTPIIDVGDFVVVDCREVCRRQLVRIQPS